MARINTVFNTMGVIGLLGITFTTTGLVRSPSTPYIGTTMSATERVRSAPTASCSFTVEAWWASGSGMIPAWRPAVMGWNDAGASVEIPPQLDGVLYWVMLMVLCYAEEEACFDVCQDQADELKGSDDVQPGFVDQFLEECNAGCWDNCNLEED